MRAFLLAAGLGTRLRPLTHRVPKCLLEVGGRPLVEHQLETLADAGVGPVGMVVGYCADAIREAVRIRNEIAPKVVLEASGGISLATVRGVAETGVDRISVGAITHSAPALDIALDWVRS